MSIQADGGHEAGIEEGWSAKEEEDPRTPRERPTRWGWGAIWAELGWTGEDVPDGGNDSSLETRY